VTGAAFIRLRLPLPPSANRYWRAVRAGKKLIMVPTDAAKDYKQQLHEANRERLPLLGRVEIHRFHIHCRGRDLDNSFKVLFDALRFVAWMDDHQVKKMREVEIFENPAMPAADQRVELEATGEGFATHQQVWDAALELKRRRDLASKTRKANAKTRALGLDLLTTAAGRANAPTGRAPPQLRPNYRRPPR